MLIIIVINLLLDLQDYNIYLDNCTAQSIVLCHVPGYKILVETTSVGLG